MKKRISAILVCLGTALSTSTAFAQAGQPHGGPAIDDTSIPAAVVGSSTRNIGATSEQAPDSDVGAFRTRCTPSHFNYDDPIVFPRQPGRAHLHMFFGNTGADANSTYNSLRATGNSTCRGGIANRSAYWIPAMINTATDGVIPAEFIDVYYKSGYFGIEPDEIRPLPRGLRMISGKAASTTGQEHAAWGCRDQGVGDVDSIPACAPGDAVRLSVRFPQCWDGVNLDSANHMSHVAHPVNGDCPASHPVALPELAYNVYFPVPAGGDTSGWRLSSDEYEESLPGGLSAHADYFEAWEPEIAVTWANRCVRTRKDCHSHLLGDGRAMTD